MVKYTRTGKSSLTLTHTQNLALGPILALTLARSQTVTFKLTLTLTITLTLNLILILTKQEVAALAADGRFDYLVIESTGISEPLPVALTFSAASASAGGGLADVARLDTMVSCSVAL